MGNPLGEFDGVQKGKFIEDKSARGLGTVIAELSGLGDGVEQVELFIG